MKNKDFAHLHVHSEYSLLDGIGTAKQWATRAKDMGFDSIACTDHGGVDGCLSWQKECIAQGINPILGAELYVTPNANIKQKGTPRGHIVILVKNQLGWEQLCALITRSWQEGFYQRPRVDYEMILECDMSGWVITTACIGSFLNLPGSIDFYDKLWDRISPNLYFEIMPANHPLQIEYHKKWLGKFSMPKVATVDCHYILPEHNKVQDMLIAIQRNYKWDDPKRWSFDFRDLYLMSADEVYNGFKAQGQHSTKDIMTAMDNTLRIASQCGQFRIQKKPVELPVPQRKKNYDIHYEFNYLVQDGFERQGLTEKKEYLHRANIERLVIEKKNFELYYLIVKDVIDFCQRENIMIGPGRGSVGGSLIAYLMGITQIDPIKHKLLFSRFISEDRNDLPDIDIDFEKNKRHLVYEYLQKTYGNGCAVLSTYPRIKTRGAIRDVGRVFDLPNKDISAFAKLFKYNEDDPEKFTSICKKEKEAINFKKAYPEAFDLVLGIIGQIRTTGQHPAAVILSSRDLRDGTTCVLKKNKTGNPIINWAMDEVEYFGLVKLDILGLSTLSVLDYAKEMINESNRSVVYDNRYRGGEFNYSSIDFKDSSVFRQISNGDTAGLFQLTTPASTNLCKQMGIECFEDIVAAIALVRPGPMDSGMTDNYLDRKHGDRWKKLNETYEEITKGTYGILVYQEQVMQVISRVAGLSESEANRIRKVIAKKRDVKGFEKYRKLFFAGCKATGKMSPVEAETFWATLEKWANYGFPKIHSVEYAVIAYWTAWVKYYYPREFYAAVLTYGELDPDSKQRMVDEMFDRNYDIIGPKVKTSDPCRWTFNGDDFYMPFVEIKGIGDTAANKCCQAIRRKTRKDIFGNSIVSEGSAIDTVLDEIRAFDDDVCDPAVLNKRLEFEL